MEPTAKVGETGDAVAGRLREFRESKGLTVRELADRTAVGGRRIHASAIVKIEARARRIDVDDLVALATALGVKPAELLTGDINDFGSLRTRWVTENEAALAPLAAAFHKARAAGITPGRIRGYLESISRMRELVDSIEIEERTDGER